MNRKTNGVYANEHEKEKLVFSGFCFFQRFLKFFFRRIAWSLFSAKITSRFHRRSYRDMTANKGPMVDPARRVQVVSGEDCSLHIEWDSTDTNRKRKRRAQIARRMGTRMKWWLFIMRQRRTKLSVRSRTVFFDILPERKNKFFCVEAWWFNLMPGKLGKKSEWSRLLLMTTRMSSNVCLSRFMWKLTRHIAWT